MSPTKTPAAASEKAKTAESANPATAGPTKEELLQARVAELEKEAAKSAAAKGADLAHSGTLTKEPEVLVPCICHTAYHQPEGHVSQRWGITFVAQKGGRALLGKVPEWAVKDGIKAGRWRPVGMDGEDANRLVAQSHYKDMFGVEAPDELSASELRQEIDEQVTKRAAVADHLRA